MPKARAKRKCEILVINQIAQVGLKRFPPEAYAVVKEAKDPEAILVRSADLHKYEFGPALRAVGRAGAGVNNIPVAALSKRGVPVFNAPGANANAVKELVIAGMLIAARNLAPALDFVRNLKNENLDRAVEDGKKQFAGVELPGHTLGVIGLGKIGSLVADAAIRLGMNVQGFDPHITVESAWSLPAQVKRATSVDEVLSGRQNLVMFGQLNHLSSRQAQRRADELLERFGLADAARVPELVPSETSEFMSGAPRSNAGTPFWKKRRPGPNSTRVASANWIVQLVCSPMTPITQWCMAGIR